MVTTPGYIRQPLFICVCALLLAGQIDDQRFNEIKAKHDRGEKITEDERDYIESKIERRNQEESANRQADYARTHPPRESTGLVPLPDLGSETYKGEPGGLYPGGENKPPRAHLDAGLRLAHQIAASGRIVMRTIGMSNTTQETRSFLKLAAVDPALNPKLTIVDCAQGAQTASRIQAPPTGIWSMTAWRMPK
jgi:hypothetical protein